MTTSDMTPAAAPTLTARCPEDLLAVVPVVLGFTPTDSVVMLTFGAQHAFHARIDLPERREDLDEVADVLLEPAQRHGVDAVVLLVYATDPGRAGAAWRSLREGCRRRRIRVVEALRADGSRWFPLCGHDRLLRDIGVAYDVTSHPFAVRAVVDGRVTHLSRADLAATIEPDPDRVALVETFTDDLRPWGLDAARSDLLAEGTWVQALVSGHADAGTSASDADVARLLRDLGSLALRDAAWAVLDRPRARAFVALWTDVVRRAPEALLPPAAALLGWAAWQAGDGALAWCAVDRCAEVDPDYSLMLMLGDALSGAVPPSVWSADFDWRESLAP